jgi:hypothetical protein
MELSLERKNSLVINNYIDYEDIQEEEEGYVVTNSNISNEMSKKMVISLKKDDFPNSLCYNLSDKCIVFSCDSNINFAKYNEFNRISSLECVLYLHNVHKMFKIASFSESDTMKILRKEHVTLRKNTRFQFYGLVSTFYSFQKQKNTDKHRIKLQIKLINKDFNIRIYEEDGLTDFMKNDIFKESLKKHLEERNIKIESSPIIYFNNKIKRFVLIPGQDEMSTWVYLNKNTNNIENFKDIQYSYPIKKDDEYVIGVNKNRVQILNID